MAGDGGLADNGCNLRGARQQRRRPLALCFEGEAIGARHVDVIAAPLTVKSGLAKGPCVQALALRELDDEGRHGRAREATFILGGRQMKTFAIKDLRLCVVAASQYCFSLLRRPEGQMFDGSRLETRSRWRTMKSRPRRCTSERCSSTASPRRSRPRPSKKFEPTAM